MTKRTLGCVEGIMENKMYDGIASDTHKECLLDELVEKEVKNDD